MALKQVSRAGMHRGARPSAVICLFHCIPNFNASSAARRIRRSALGARRPLRAVGNMRGGEQSRASDGSGCGGLACLGNEHDRGSQRHCCRAARSLAGSAVCTIVFVVSEGNDRFASGQRWRSRVRVRGAHGLERHQDQQQHSEQVAERRHGSIITKKPPQNDWGGSCDAQKVPIGSWPSSSALLCTLAVFVAASLRPIPGARLRRPESWRHAYRRDARCDSRSAT